MGRLKLFRDEMDIVSIDHDEIARIASINYNPENFDRLLPGSATQVMATGFPLLIYAYTFSFSADCNLVGYQTATQANNATDVKEQSRNWDATNPHFVRSLRKYGICPGNQANYATRTLKFKAKRNPKHLHKKFGKWKIPPIYMGPEGLDYLTWMVINKTPGSTARTVYAIVSIDHWKQLT